MTGASAVFRPKNFATMVEEDVREDIITPLLHRLGYEKDSENDIRRGHYLILRYPKESFGTRKPNDRALTGFADYVLDVGKKIRWVLEAKAPANGITDADVSQAYSYAKHPEVKAVLYCLCDGRELRIYDTNVLPDADLLFSIKYENFESNFEQIANILSPNAMHRDWNGVQIDTGKPIAPNLRSSMRISGGFYRHTSIVPTNEFLTEFNFQVISGVIGRDENGRLIGVVNTRSPLQSAQLLSEKIGTDKIDFVSSDSVISTDPLKPTIFVSDSEFTFPEGETILNFTYPKDVTFRTRTKLFGHLENYWLKGTFHVLWEMNLPFGNFETSGVFEIGLT